MELELHMCQLACDNGRMKNYITVLQRAPEVQDLKIQTCYIELVSFLTLMFKDVILLCTIHCSKGHQSLCVTTSAVDFC